jgi:6-phosphogluconolactonase
VSESPGSPAGSSSSRARPEIHVFDDEQSLARAAAEIVVATAGEAMQDGGRFKIALSGGSTPKRLYELMATEQYARRIEWARVEVFWGDERCVPPTHPDSNFRMARETLLDHVPVRSDAIHRVETEEDDPGAAAAGYERELAQVLGGAPGGSPPALDLVFLGMGADGHTASLFPGTPALHERRRWVVAVRLTGSGPVRITLTYPVLARAAHVLFLVTGRDKAATLREVLHGPPAADRLPAQAVRPESGELVWLVDRDAAAALG